MRSKPLTLKDMIDGSGCTPRTVRYYEREGLLRAARTSGGHRLFQPAELERLRFIIALREAGWTLEEVTEFLDVRGQGDGDREAMRRLESLMQAHVARLERKLEILKQLRADLDQTGLLLKVCHACVPPSGEVACETCDRLAPLGELPRSFRLAWRARELDEQLFDDPSADGAEGEATP